jgi:hypothetical protein
MDIILHDLKQEIADADALIPENIIPTTIAIMHRVEKLAKKCLGGDKKNLVMDLLEWVIDTSKNTDLTKQILRSNLSVVPSLIDGIIYVANNKKLLKSFTNGKCLSSCMR